MQSQYKYQSKKNYRTQSDSKVHMEIHKKPEKNWK